MRRILKIFSFLLAMLFAGNMTSQVRGISYALSFGASTLSYDCFIIIYKGETLSKKQGIQFNSQVSIVVPTGSNLEVSKLFMPFNDNINHKNRNSIELLVTDVVFSLSEDSRLFSRSTISNENEISDIGLYENEVDKEIVDKEFSNGFSLGNSNQIFKGIVMIDIVAHGFMSNKKTTKVG